MFSKNLKYYRLRKQLKKKDLAELAEVTPTAISYYESGKRNPDMETLKRLAKALDVRVSDFLASRSSDLKFRHGEFRKNTNMSLSRQEYVRESVEEYFDRFMTVTDFLGGEVLPDVPDCDALTLQDDDEANAAALREHLGFAKDGPIEDLIGKLENKGILVCECRIENSQFSGMNGFVNDRPYIVYNPRMNTERNRSTIGHELAHLMFRWPEDMDDRTIELRATSISGAFLFPRSDVIRELGIKRSSVTGDMVRVAIEYGISMYLLVKRAELCGVLSQDAAKRFYVLASRLGWKTNEPPRIAEEHPTLFAQLACRAVNEGEISIQRGAELLGVSYEKVREICSFGAEVQ